MNVAVALTERRTNHAMRQRIAELVEQGYSITWRERLRLERGRIVLIVRGGVIING